MASKSKKAGTEKFVEGTSGILLNQLLEGGGDMNTSNRDRTEPRVVSAAMQPGSKVAP